MRWSRSAAMRRSCSSASRRARESKDVCDVEGDSHWKFPLFLDCERARRGMDRSPTTAPMEGTRGCLSSGRSSTMTGRPRSRCSRSLGRGLSITKGGEAGDEGAVKVLNVWGGVLGVGGESTMTMRSLRWVRVGLRAGMSLRRLVDLRRWRRPSSDE